MEERTCVLYRKYFSKADKEQWEGMTKGLEGRLYQQSYFILNINVWVV